MMPNPKKFYSIKEELFLIFSRNYTVDFFSGFTETQDSYEDAVMKSIMKLHYDCPAKEDILAFLTGQEEIETAAQSLRQILQATDRPCPKGIVVPLYASQQVSAQQKVFTPTKEGCRKIILATNIAETSLTIPGVKHVIDSCRVKAK